MKDHKNKDNRIRVDFVISTLNRGGAENKLVAAANGIDNTKYSVRVLVLKGGPLTAELTVPFYENIISNKYSITGFLSLISLLRKRRTQIVWVVGNGDAGFFGRIAAKLAFVPHVIQSLHATGRVGNKPTIDPGNQLLDRIGFLTSKYIAVAKAHMEYLVLNEGLRREKISHIYNGVDTTVFCPGNADDKLRGELNIPKGVDVIGIVARFKPEKRHSLFLNAAKEIIKTRPETHFLIVGDGPHEHEVKKQVTDLGLDERVHFAGGVNTVAPYYHLMNVLMLCSNSVETFPNVVLESMASGTPVITTDVGSVTEAIIDMETGLVVPQEDTLALANGAIKILSDSTLRNKIAINAIARVDKYFTIVSMINARESLFETLTKN